jgi:hypothetical protein
VLNLRPTPISNDAVNGPPMIINLAVITAWVGDKGATYS